MDSSLFRALGTFVFWWGFAVASIAAPGSASVAQGVASVASFTSVKAMNVSSASSALSSVVAPSIALEAMTVADVSWV